MAILTHNDLSFEFCFKELDDCLWIQYEIYFKWKGEPVFRDELLKTRKGSWEKRSHGALKANDCEEDYFLAVLNKVLEDNVRAHWVPTDPAVVVGFYPDEPYPFYPSPPKLLYAADHVIEEALERDELKAESGGKLPDDIISMVVFIDVHNWNGAIGYHDQGFCLCMLPHRWELEKFYTDLCEEWEQFKIRERYDERIEEDRNSD